MTVNLYGLPNISVEIRDKHAQYINESFFRNCYYYIIIIITIIELTHSKTILENTVEIEPQPVVLDFKNLAVPSRTVF